MLPHVKKAHFLLAEDSFPSRNTYKRAVLRGQLSLLGVLVGIIYTILDLLNNLYVSIPVYAILISLCLLVFWINRMGKYFIANVIFLSLLVVLIYVFADNDLNRTGVGTYFIMYALMALTLCGYDHIAWGLFFCVLGLIGFLLAYYADLPPVIQPAPYSEKYINISFFTNFSVSFFVAVALLFFSMNINYKTEQELIHNNQLLSKTNEELDRFVYSASHDLRAPLSSVLGLIEIAIRSGDSKEVTQCLSLMKVRIADLDAFIKEIIDYSRNARQEVQKESFKLNEVVLEVIEGLKFAHTAKNISIKNKVPDEFAVTSDRARLKVILSNLIGNALKYSNPRLEQPQVTIGAHAVNGAFKINIEDNGIGIKPEHLPRIFEMFYRASERSEGSGLGLYIVKETVSKLDGRVNVQSTFGEGSTFSIEIPA